MSDINLQVIDVELSPLKEQQINHHIGSLRSLVPDQSRTTCDVIIRSIKRPLSSELFCVMVRMKTPEQSYYAVGMEHAFFKAVRAVERELRKSLSRTYVPDTATIEYLRRHAHERFFVELFVT
jgi:hypothetical protein